MNRLLWFITLILGAGLFFAQANETGPIASPTNLQQLLDRPNREPDSELEKRVFADNVVTPEEYQESVDAYIGCMNDAGYTVEVSANPWLLGVYQYAVSLGDDSDTPVADEEFDTLMKIDLACSEGTTQRIEAAYSSQIANPDDVDQWWLTLECLVNNGILEEDALIPEELELLLTSETSEAPFDWNDHQVISCLVNPSQNGLDGNPERQVTSETNPNSSNGSYHDQIRRYVQAEAVSEFEQRVLEDGYVTPQEYEEAVQLYVSCMASESYLVIPQPSVFVPDLYLFITTSDPAATPVTDEEWVAAVEQAEQLCMETYLNLISMLYTVQVTIPVGMEPLEAAHQCMIDKGYPLVLTVEELNAELMKATPELGFNLYEPHAWSCLENPAQTGLPPAGEPIPGAEDMFPATPAA